jgi:RHS repeat-associated protein
LDSSQAETDTFAYWPYGEEVSRTGTTNTPFTFVGTLGYYRDSATRSYVRARHLDTGAGRWMTEDPIGFAGGDWNLYRYVQSKPASAADTTGLQFGHSYGNCCGYGTSSPGIGPGKPNPGIDCIDKACCRHDWCLRDWWCVVVPGRLKWCNANLCKDALACISSGCSRSSNPAACSNEAKKVAAAFCAATVIPKL